MCPYVSNPFQILGVSDPSPIITPSMSDVKLVTPVPVQPTLVSTDTAAKGLAPNVPPVQKNPGSPILPIAIPEKKAGKALSFLHKFAMFFMDDALPIVLQIGLPILERKI